MNTVHLSPAEFYYLARMMHAEKIHYLHIQTTTEDFTRPDFDWVCADQLIQREILEPSLMGDPVIRPDLQDVFSAVFHFEHYALLTNTFLYPQDTEGPVASYYFFYWNNTCHSLLFHDENGICIADMSEQDFAALILSLLPEGYLDVDALKQRQFPEHTTYVRSITAHVPVDEQIETLEYRESNNGLLLRSVGEGENPIVSPSMYFHEMKQQLWGC